MSSEILLYQNHDGNIQIDVRLEDETVWLNQAQMGQLFGKDKRTISEHIKNVFTEGELDENMVVRKFRTTTQHGAIAGKTQEHEVKGYNLEVHGTATYPNVYGRLDSAFGYHSSAQWPRIALTCR